MKRNIIIIIFILILGSLSWYFFDDINELFKKSENKEIINEKIDKKEPEQKKELNQEEKLNIIIKSNNLEACEDLSDNLKNICKEIIKKNQETNQAISSKNPEKCNDIKDNSLRTFCFNEINMQKTLELVTDELNIIYCLKNFKDQSLEDICKDFGKTMIQAIKEKDPSFCEKYEDERKIRECKKYVLPRLR
jgi:translation initiation factor IF-2